MSVDVRPVTAQDLPELIAFITAVLAEFGLEFGKGSTTDDQLRSLPSSYTERGGAFWIARATSGELIGTCGVFPIAPATYELRKMYVSSAARGLGLGTRLLDVATAWTRAAGGHTMVLDTVESMARAIAFYEAHGFSRDDAQIRGSRCTRGYTKRLT